MVPPAGIWNAVVAALEDQSSTVADTLQNLEVAPPTHLWQYIEDQLDTDRATQPQHISLHKRISKPLRYGSAVAILVLIAVTTTLLLHKDAGSGELAQQPTQAAPAGNKALPSVTSGTKPESNQQLPTQAKDNREPVAQPDKPSLLADNTPAEKSTQHLNDHRYLTVATETGAPVRLSKKVYPVFDCAEHNKTLQRHQCKQNIESLQKMASSLASPSGDFASLIDMIKTLEENR